MKKMNKESIPRKLLRVFIVLLIFYCMNFWLLNQVKASQLVAGVTESYERWSKLSDEEKEKYIQPLPFSVPYDGNTKIYQQSRLAMFQSLKNSYQSQYKITDLTIKDQLDTYECWAFATTTMLESNIAKTTNSTSPLFSPRHMDYATSKTFLDGINPYGFNRELGAGGNYYISMAYCTNGKGPVLETDMPFENNEDKINLAGIEGKTVAQQINSYVNFPSIYKEHSTSDVSYYNGYSGSISLRTEYTETEVQDIRNKIKDHIIKYGAVTAFTYMGGSEDISNYFNIEKVQSGTTSYYAYHCDDNEVMADHAITIVGWDDTFSADNFNDAHKPKHDGAYIIQNSYGTELLNGGYLYVSYDDVLIEQCIFGIVDTSSVQYDNIYQHDPLGYSTDFTPQSDSGATYSSLYGANVFSRDTTVQKQEKLTKISFYVGSTTNVEVYANAEDGDLSKIQAVKSMGTLEPGYYTCELDTPLTLTGSQFVVAIKYSADVVQIPLECNYPSNGLTSNFWDTATSSRGESYLSVNQTAWTDLLDLNIKDSNICIKAFSNYEEENTTVSVDAVTLNTNMNTMEVGDTFTLVATVMPTNATNKNVTWSSNNTNVATVDANGKVTAIATGDATITVTTEDGLKTATCQVTVTSKASEEISVTGVELNASTHTMKVGDTFTLTAKVLPDDATNKTVTWSSNNTDIATVDENGKVTAVSKGSAVIKVTTQDGLKTGTCQIIVEEDDIPVVEVTGVTLDITTKNIEKGSTYTLIATVMPESATNKKVNWSSSNTDVATVDENGKITAIAVGDATITATTEDGAKTATCNITVTEEKEPGDVYVKVMKISLNTQGETLYIGDTFQLTATITPDNATNQNIVWESSDESIATVDSNGKIKAVSKGIVTIIAKNVADNVSESCVITVLEEEDKNIGDIVINNDPELDDTTIQPVTPSNSGDSSTAPGIIPQAGMSYFIIISLIVIMSVAIVLYIRLHKAKDIK